jgi:hypothetical protein
MPLAVYLIGREYTDAARNRIVDAVGDGAFLESLVVSRDLERDDLAGAVEALEEGRAWHARYSGRAVPKSAAIVPPELEDDDPTADADGDPVYYDRGVPAPLPEHEPFHPGPDGDPYEPTEADLDELSQWMHGLDDARDGMAFPEKTDSLADRKRWQHQNNLTDRSFGERP